MAAFSIIFSSAGRVGPCVVSSRVSVVVSRGVFSVGTMLAAGRLVTPVSRIAIVLIRVGASAKSFSHDGFDFNRVPFEWHLRVEFRFDMEFIANSWLVSKQTQLAKNIAVNKTKFFVDFSHRRH